MEIDQTINRKSMKRSRGKRYSRRRSSKRICKRKYTLKYKNRNSPPYQANSSDCRGKIKTGNDGKKYNSVSIMRQGKQVYIWRKYKAKR